MKKILLCGTAIVLLVLVGCSGSSPSAGPVPTPPSQTWAITSLTVSSSQPQVLEEVLISAAVTKDGAAVADGTTVTFEITNAGSCQDASGNTIPCAWFTSNSTASASVASSGGRANVYMTAAVQATFTVVARAGNASKTVNVFFRQPDQSADLHIYSVVPTQGSLAGGEEVILTGKGVYTPVEAYFVVNGTDFEAQVLSVIQGDTDGSIRIRTPAITGVDTAQEYQADIRIVRGVGTSYEQEEVLSAAFRLTPTSGDPEIYQLYPDHGSARGGEQVTILGRNFETPVRVTFNTSVGTLEADEVTVSPDHTQITLMTPQVSAGVLQADDVASVTVVTRAGSQFEKTTTKTAAFVFVADQPQPNITAVSPSSGPIEGGTRVTIFGTGFVSPLQVFFEGGTIGSREANIVSINFNQIVVTSPDITPTQPTPPVTVDVRVVNVDSGLEDTLGGAFTYGESMFVSGNTPTSGPADAATVVTIFGGGFRDPLLVDWGSLRVETISVSGSEVLVRMPALVPVPCGDTTGSFTLTHSDTGLTASGGSFTYIGPSPIIIAVQPSSAEYAPATPVTISGQEFTDPAVVQFGSSPEQLPATFIDSSTLQVDIPDPITIPGFAFDEVACFKSGVEGVRSIPTGVDVTVTNVATGCSDTLQNGFAYIPSDDTCRIGPVLVTAPLVSGQTWNFGDVDFGSSAAQTLNISNTGDSNLTLSAAVTGTGFSLTAAPASPVAPAPPPGTTTLDVTFTPPADGGATYSGTLTITSNDPNNSPVVITLAGRETP